MQDPQARVATDLLTQDLTFLDVQADFTAALKETRPYLELDLVEDIEAAHKACVQAAFKAGQERANPHPGLAEAVRLLLDHPAIQTLQEEEEEEPE